MTSIPATPSSTGQAIPASPPRPSGFTAPPTPAQVGTIDPIKLLNRYKWVLVSAGILGGFVGGGAYYVTTKFFPKWRPAALFNCLPPAADVSVTAGMVNDSEMLRFMQTQVRFMTSNVVFTRVSEDPALQNNAPNWCKEFQTTDPQTGLPRFDTQEAAKDLKDQVAARVIPQTTLIELSMTDRDKRDATEILKLVREKYEALLRDQVAGDLDDRIKSLRVSLSQYDQEINGYATRRDSLIKQRNVTSLDNQVDTTRIELTTINDDLIEIGKNLDAGRTRLKQLETERLNPGGIAFGDEMRADIDRDPLVLDLKSNIARLESYQQTLLNKGVSRGHREYLEIEAQILGATSNLRQTTDDLLNKSFAAQVDGLNKTIASLESQQQNLGTQRESLTTRLNELAQTQSILNDYAQQITSLTQAKSTSNAELQNLVSLTQFAAANRVVLAEAERIPTQMSLPSWKVMVPGGMAACVGLAGVLMLLRELVDQRVKGPSDIAIIPRTRVLGWVPDAQEDLAGQGAAETAFRDRPKGILAESYRQIRSGLAKRLQAADLRTVLVLAGMPGSGATSAVANLALAFASSDKKVLVIDANFRRPALHRVFALPESPGLGDILGRAKDFSQAVQATSTPNLDLLTAGSKEHRVFERLSTEAMTEVLAKAKGTYDVVLIDVAPAIVAGDGVALAQRCDAALLVVRALAEKRGMVARVRNEMAESKGEFLGVIVNAVKHAAGGYMKRNIKTAYEYQQT